MNKQIVKTSDEENIILDKIVLEESLYLAVISQLDIDPKNHPYKLLVLDSLKRQTRDWLVLSIWRNLDKKQTTHLNDFMRQSFVTAPDMEADDILIQFALLYSDLMEKVAGEMSEFFKGFIVRFNELRTA